METPKRKKSRYTYICVEKNSDKISENIIMQGNVEDLTKSIGKMIDEIATFTGTNFAEVLTYMLLSYKPKNTCSRIAS